jgi:hypothetical protein
MLDTLADIEVLLVLNLALYGSAIGGYLRGRRPALRPIDPALAFGLLEKSLKSAFPDLPEGFTWREAMDRLGKAGLILDWPELSTALRQYEGWRYGEMAKPDRVDPEVVRLSKELAKRGRKWPRI